jgi:hypothetical protein
LIFFSIFTPMKHARQILTILLSAYLLVLMVMPCSDAHSAAAGGTEALLTQSAKGHHHDAELCTPFCVCASCTAAVVLQPSLEFEVLQFEPHYTYAANFYKSIASSFYGSIWQPPQLV